MSTVINDNNRGAGIAIAAALCLVCTVMFLGTRVVIRYPWKSLFGLDDATTVVATVLGVIQTIVIFVAIHKGLGKNESLLSPASVTHIEKACPIATL